MKHGFVYTIALGALLVGSHAYAQDTSVGERDLTTSARAAGITGAFVGALPGALAGALLVGSSERLSSACPDGQRDFACNGVLYGVAAGGALGAVAGIRLYSWMSSQNLSTAGTLVGAGTGLVLGGLIIHGLNRVDLLEDSDTGVVLSLSIAIPVAEGYLAAWGARRRR